MGFNIFHVLVVDLLHKFEIGMWKMLFVHLLRIIVLHDKCLIHELDQRYGSSEWTCFIQLSSPIRYRQTLTFGQATIWKFLSNSSDMKRMAAHNFEDLLQVWPPRPPLKSDRADEVCSVPSLYSMVFCLNHTTQSSFSYCLRWPIGMGWLSSECILT